MMDRAVDRFLSNVEMGDCWLWTGAVNDHGYGRFSIRIAANKWRSFLAHRFSYETFVGPIPEGQFVLHRCDIPGCVRPDHLFTGTQAENIADAKRKGRMKGRPGERDGKLSIAQRQEILTRYTGRYGEQSELAREYGVTQSRIWALVHGVKYA